MNNQALPTEFYTARINEIKQALQKLYKQRTLLGFVRFAIIAATVLIVYFTWYPGIYFIIFFILAGIAMFLFVVSKDTDNKEEIENLETLLSINEKELQYAKGNYLSNYSGKNYEPELHAYAADLDLFGKASLYQYINRCNAEKAKALIAKRLLQPLNKEEILQHQEALKELSSKPLWMQQLIAYGTKQQITFSTEQRVLKWLSSEDKYFDEPVLKILLYIFPVITLGSVYLYFFDFITGGILSLLFLIFYGVSLSFSKKITPTYNLLSKIVNEISVLYKELLWFEKEKFQSILLNKIQQGIKHDLNTRASAEILNLKKILNRFDVRLNVFAFIIVNTFFLWDLRQIIALKKWKKENATIVPKWFNAIASIEVINSFGILYFNHPYWCFPVIAEEHFTLSGEEIGHPLIPEAQRVNNSFHLEGFAKIDLITGSNMAGKSTFLRSIGVNMILAFAGAPVCAKQFTVSIVNLLSSMRVTDNLAENTSTFYAELKKLKSIIVAVNNNQKVLILLDEILRGTNSLDRHTGSAALIKQLIKQNTVAIIATHDVELAKLEETYPLNILNYHFDVQVEGEELYFDYKLKEGICTSLNASLLMKKIGIELS